MSGSSISWSLLLNASEALTASYSPSRLLRITICLSVWYEEGYYEIISDQSCNVLSDLISFSGSLSESLPDLSGKNIGQKCSRPSSSSCERSCSWSSFPVSRCLMRQPSPLQAPDICVSCFSVSVARPYGPFRSASWGQNISKLCASLFHFAPSKPKTWFSPDAWYVLKGRGA